MTFNWKGPGRYPCIALGGALLVVGLATGAGAVALTRPAVEMAPTIPTAIGKLGGTKGIVSVRGHVVETYGDRFVVADQTGRTLVDAGRAGAELRTGSQILVQGRFENGQLRARYLVDGSNTVQEVGPGPRHDAGPPPPPPPPPHTGAGAPPPPPPPGRDGADSLPPPLPPVGEPQPSAGPGTPPKPVTMQN